MTIAACYLSADGVVFGADSTTTMYVAGVGPEAQGCDHHYDFAQKIFQIGENSTLGLTMWGLGNLHEVSYRTLIAQFADALIGQGPKSMAEVASYWSQFFWNSYSADFGLDIQRAQALQSKATRTPAEDEKLESLMRAFSGGFCIGGYLMTNRLPAAYEVRYNPTMTGPGCPEPIKMGSARFWGCENLVNRLLYGIDINLFSTILQSEKWEGTESDLIELVAPHCLGQPQDLPIREAIDWVHASIYTTIKTMKFSHIQRVCGGPVEIAVITSDRQFRWVRHKGFDSAIGDGGILDVHHHTR